MSFMDKYRPRMNVGPHIRGMWRRDVKRYGMAGAFRVWDAYRVQRESQPRKHGLAKGLAVGMLLGTVFLAALPWWGRAVAGLARFPTRFIRPGGKHVWDSPALGPGITIVAPWWGVGSWAQAERAGTPSANIPALTALGFGLKKSVGWGLLSAGFAGGWFANQRWGGR